MIGMFVDKIFNKLGPVVRNNHSSHFFSFGAKVCEKYLYYYRNEKYWDMDNNGEALLLRIAGLNLKDRTPLVIFDVGANRGNYAAQVCKILPTAEVHCFEIVPYTRSKLAENMAGKKNIIICDCGLSNAETCLQIGFNHKADDSAREISSFSGEVDEIIACRVIRGDKYLAEHGIKKLALLKIDVEGHEMAVLEGFKNALSEAMINVIQFEYGTTWISSRRFMHEAYSLLEPAGYFIGRLYPEGVKFKTYDRLNDDRFYMGNYVAVHNTCLPVINSLKLNHNEHNE